MCPVYLPVCPISKCLTTHDGSPFLFSFLIYLYPKEITAFAACKTIINNKFSINVAVTNYLKKVLRGLIIDCVEWKLPNSLYYTLIQVDLGNFIWTYLLELSCGSQDPLLFNFCNICFHQSVSGWNCQHSCVVFMFF